MSSARRSLTAVKRAEGGISRWRSFERKILAGLELFRGRPDRREMVFQSGAVIRPEFQNRQSPTGQILLMAKVLVRDDEEVKPGVLGRGQEVAIFDSRPALFLDGGGGVVLRECLAHLRGNAFVEQDLHAAAWCSSSCWLFRRTPTANSRETDGKDSRK